MLKFALLLTVSTGVYGHGNMLEPPSRAVKWDCGFPIKPPSTKEKNYNWRSSNCGEDTPSTGMQMCGICGDKLTDEPRAHELPNGKFADGKIVRKYKPGQLIPVTIKLTAHHKGYVEFRLCPNTDINQDPEQACFDKMVLSIENTKESNSKITEGTKFQIMKEMSVGLFSMMVRLPMVECERCILQWTYMAGNDDGNHPYDKLEAFKACADISISSANNLDWLDWFVDHSHTCGSYTAERDSVGKGGVSINTADDVVNANEVDNANAVDNANDDSTDVNTSGSDSAVMTKEKPCVSTEEYSHFPTMTKWCQDNCEGAVPFCPCRFCNCKDCVEDM